MTIVYTITLTQGIEVVLLAWVHLASKSKCIENIANLVSNNAFGRRFHAKLVIHKPNVERRVVND